MYLDRIVNENCCWGVIGLDLELQESSMFKLFVRKSTAIQEQSLLLQIFSMCSLCVKILSRACFNVIYAVSM